MIYRFGDVVLDTEALAIHAGGAPRACEPQAFALLQLLIENRDRVVPKDELIERIWNRRVVSDSALNSCVNAARRAVGDDGRTQGVIRTVPKRGFRFVAALQDPAPKPAGPPPTAPSIAVMPFRNLSSDPEQDFLADGMLEDLVMTLSRVRWLEVIGSSTMFTFRGQEPPGEVAEELGVRYLLSGSVRKSAERLRVSAQLFDCAERRAIWAELYDRQTADIFDVQDDITVQVAAAVEHELGLAEQARAARTRPENLDAWLAYQMAISRIRAGRSAVEIDQIAALFDRAIGLDPGFALARAGRAFAEYWRFVEGLGGTDLALAFEQAQQAIALDPLEPFAHQALGSVRWAEGSLQGALDSWRRALELNPSFTWSHFLLGMGHVTLGETDAARRSIETAIRLSPRDTLIGIFYAGIALCHLSDGRYRNCVEWGRRGMAYPQPRWVHAYALSALGHLGDAAEAREMRTLISRVRPDFSVAFIDANFPILQGEPRARFLDGLRLAGLRES